MESIQPKPLSTMASSHLSTIQDVLAYLLSHRVGDFYARFISSLPSREMRGNITIGSHTQRFMMGVSFERGHHVLLYNPDWISETLEKGKAGLNELRATFAHEAEHVILAHIARAIKLHKKMSNKEEIDRFWQVSNFAADCAVNDLLRREKMETDSARLVYPTFADEEAFWVLPSKMGLPDELTYEWYVTLLMDENSCIPNCSKLRCNGNCRKAKAGEKGNVSGKHKPECLGHEGAHDKWKDLADQLSEEEAEVLAQQIEQDAYEKLKQVSEEHKRARGTVPGHIEERLEEMLKPPAIPWKRIMHQFVTRCRLSKPLRAMERPRKRWLNLGSTLYPGLKRDRTFKLFFAIDTSGSMSSDDLHEGLEELQGIQKVERDTEVTVVEFDAQIHKEYKLKYNDPIDVNLRGRGGTDFNAAFERALELSKKDEVDAIIIYTDGFAPAPNALMSKPIDIPVLWCLTEGGEHPCPGYGFEIRRPKTA